jgi:hypothetical protein
MHHAGGETAHGHRMDSYDVVLLVNEQDDEVFPIYILEVGMEKRADIGRASHLLSV